MEGHKDEAERLSRANGHDLGPWEQHHPNEHPDHWMAYCNGCGKDATVGMGSQGPYMVGPCPSRPCEAQGREFAQEQATEAAQLHLDNDEKSYKAIQAIVHTSRHPTETSHLLGQYIRSLPASHPLHQELRDEGWTPDDIDTDGWAEQLHAEHDLNPQDGAISDADIRRHLSRRRRTAVNNKTPNLPGDGTTPTTTGPNAEPVPQAGQTTGNDGYTQDDVPMMSVGPPTITDPNQVSTKPRQEPSGGGAGGMGGAGGGFPGQDPMAESGDLGAGAPDDETGLQAPLPGGEPNDPAQPGLPMGGAQPAPGTFDPAASGGPEQEQHAETSGDDAENSNGDADGDGDDDSSEPDNADSKKKKALRRKANAMLTRVLIDNPGLSRQSALAVVKQAMEWENVEDGNLTGRISEIPVKRQYGPHPWGGPRQLRDEQGNPMYDQFGNVRIDEKRSPGFMEQGLQHMSPRLLERAQQRWRNRGQRGQQGDPSAPAADPAPQSKPSAPSPSGPPTPKTVGEAARQMQDLFPGDQEVRRNTWKDRYSGQPLGGEGDPSAPEHEDEW